MSNALKIRKIGNSLGIILPSELLNQHHMQEGDNLFASVDNEGLSLSPYDPEFEAIMKAADSIDRKYKNALKQLAK